MKNMTELADRCADNGGVLAVTLGDLRDAVGADRLGRMVMNRITAELDANGLGHFPLDVLKENDQPRQWHEVRIYRKGNSATARAIQAVLHPNPRRDQFLGELGDNGAAQTLDRVRELVCLSE